MNPLVGEEWMRERGVVFDNFYTRDPTSANFGSTQQVQVQELAQLSLSASPREQERAAGPLLAAVLRIVKKSDFTRDVVRVIMHLITHRSPDVVHIVLGTLQQGIPVLNARRLYTHPARGVITNMCLNMTTHPVAMVRRSAYEFATTFFTWPFVTPGEKAFALQRLCIGMDVTSIDNDGRLAFAKMLLLGCEHAVPWSVEHVLTAVGRLCDDPFFSVRKLMANALVKVAALAAGDEAIIADVVSMYKLLATDTVLTVRKAAAEHLGALAQVVPPGAGKDDLVAVFHVLTAPDEERWVRSAALGSLGLLIASFVDPPPTQGLGELDTEYWLPQFVLQPPASSSGGARPGVGGVGSGGQTWGGESTMAAYEHLLLTKEERTKTAPALGKVAARGQHTASATTTTSSIGGGSRGGRGGGSVRSVIGGKPPATAGQAVAGTVVDVARVVGRKEAAQLEAFALVPGNDQYEKYLRELEQVERQEQAAEEERRRQQQREEGKDGEEEQQKKKKKQQQEQQQQQHQPQPQQRQDQQGQGKQGGGKGKQGGGGDLAAALAKAALSSPKGNARAAADSTTAPASSATPDATPGATPSTTGTSTAANVSGPVFETGLVMGGDAMPFDDDDDGDDDFGGPILGGSEMVMPPDDGGDDAHSHAATKPPAAPMAVAAGNKVSSSEQAAQSAAKPNMSSSNSSNTNTNTNTSNTSATPGATAAKESGGSSSGGKDDEDVPVMHDEAEDKLLRGADAAAPPQQQLGAAEELVREFRQDLAMQQQLMRKQNAFHDHHVPAPLTRPRSHTQQPCAVPDDLLTAYCAMADEEANILHPELGTLCAFSVAAVAWALGEDHFGRIADTVAALQQSHDWSVRSTLAACIHDIARIVGRDAAQEHLFPLYDELMQDWTQVRDALVPHLVHFFGVLSVEHRTRLLPLIPDLIESDEVSQWRSRCVLADQLVYLTQMFPSSAVARYFVPIVHRFIHDRVYAVRVAATRPAGVVAWRFKTDGKKPELASFLAAVRDRLLGSSSNTNSSRKQGAKSPARNLAKRADINRNTRYAERIVFIEFFSQVACHCQHEDMLPIFPHLRPLLSDPVANVRMRAVHAVHELTVLHHTISWPRAATAEMWAVIEQLQNDDDSDVRAAAVDAVAQKEQYEKVF
ncbi:hypothetical protein PTSG_09074 [Salpingoeca rosetta]|uniref:Uncharacterized protein n=1 Tax=Salpingoeca rosetta (strain ATCC 50818 / BSB-021) TaxID=946362 RepID=F2UM48_SALR5|nr:uncharacterized protein PTSG_09074 [Salpingoeca rosetta]EGD78197.1 hypothetical protein PTSG_09074 [Salpingoeca rosetta]|eukprot:XP_004989873.1 hypothetical protein PTSG_09074 [Salpingoeca rosetta]